MRKNSCCVHIFICFSWLFWKILLLKVRTRSNFLLEATFEVEDQIICFFFYIISCDACTKNNTYTIHSHIVKSINIHRSTHKKFNLHIKMSKEINDKLNIFFLQTFLRFSYLLESLKIHVSCSNITYLYSKIKRTPVLK